MTIDVRLIDVKRNEEGRKAVFVPTENRLSDALKAEAAKHEFEPALIVSLQVQSDEGASFVFNHEVYPVTSLDEGVAEAHAALMQFAANLQHRLAKPTS